MKPSLKQRAVLKALGIKISADGTRWTAPRKHQDLVERAFWRVVVTGPKGTITLRWLP
jgi:hypothetical protein